MKNRILKNLIDEEGALTVFLSLMMVAMVCFITLMIDLARLSAAKVEAQDANRLAVNAVMSDYYPELRETYGLFGFKSDISGRAYECVQMSTEGGNKGFINLQMGSVNVSCSDGYTLGNDSVLKGQIMDEMKYLYEFNDMRYSYNPEYMYLATVEDSVKSFKKMWEEELEQQRLEEERLEQERLEREQQEQERLKQEQKEREQQEKEWNDTERSMWEQQDEERRKEEERRKQQERIEAEERRLKKEQDNRVVEKALERLDRAGEILKEGGAAIEEINNCGEGFLLAEYVEGFFSGKVNLRDNTLNGQSYAGAVRTAPDSEREYILYGAEVDKYEEDLKDVLFYINLMQLVDKEQNNTESRMSIPDMIRSVESGEEDLYDRLINKGTVNVGRKGRYIYFNYEQLEEFLLTEACIRNENEVLQRIREVINRNMQATGYAGFSLESCYTKALVRTDYTVHTPYVGLFNGSTDSHIYMEGEAVY